MPLRYHIDSDAGMLLIVGEGTISSRSASPPCARGSAIPGSVRA
jgi:hypothetical protein